MPSQHKIKVLVVDDSALMRQMISTILNADPRIEVVGVALNPKFAEKKIKTLQPDVLTLDVEMPEMDGITFLEQLMQQSPMPVVMVSSHTKKSAEATFRALELGAVDFVTKPEQNIRKNLDGLASELCAKVKAAANAHVHKPASLAINRYSLEKLASGIDLRQAVIAIGASAGGTEAIKEILSNLSPPMPGIVIVQHMPAKFTNLFAKRLDGQCDLEVREALHNDEVAPGTVLIAPGGFHMALHKFGGRTFVKVYEGEAVNRHAPSVDVLFESVAKFCGSSALGIILSGMGKDGAEGMLTMCQSGAYTIAQDKESCVVFGMPDRAIRLHAVSSISPLSSIPFEIMSWLQKNYAVSSAK